MGEINYNELDPGIRKTVKWLRSYGFDTTDSGDGKWKVGGPMDEGDEVLRIPHVFITARGADDLVPEANRLMAHLVGAGITVWPMGRDGAMIQATYDPADSTATIQLFGLDDSMLKAVTP